MPCTFLKFQVYYTDCMIIYEEYRDSAEGDEGDGGGLQVDFKRNKYPPSHFLSALIGHVEIIYTYR